MASHGMFAKDAPYRGKESSYRGKQGRRVNFHDQHDDRWSDSGGSGGNRGGNRDNDRGSYGGGSRGRGRGGGGGGGRWTRGNRGRGNSRGGGRGSGNYDDQDYRDYNDGDNRSYRGKNRYTPYTKSPPGGSRGGGGPKGSGSGRDSVFNRLGQSFDDYGGHQYDDQYPRRGNSRGGGQYRGQPRGGPRGKGNVFGRLSGMDHRRGGRNDGGASRGEWGNDRFKRMDSGDQMEEDTSAVLLQVLGERYDSNSSALNLSDMFHDATFQEHKIRSSMYDAAFVNSILEQIATHCPTLIALDLSKNKLQRLQVYSHLSERCPYIQTLDLSDNELRNVQELEAIAPMTSVTNLSLENNPFRTYFQDFGSYSQTVRKYFPNLQNLDGQPLPGPIKFDLPTNVGTLPPSQKAYLVNEEVRSLVVSFLEQFYSLYDGETRDKLLEAYSDNAVFSLSVDMPHQQQRGPPFHQYIPLSRNLVRVQDPSKRSSLLKHGRIDIVQCLRQFPQTHHLSNSFSVDVMKATPMCTGFTVYGLFGEASSGGKSSSSSDQQQQQYPVRAFTRTFIIVAAGTGVAIVNDQLTIRNAAIESVKLYSDEVQSHFAKLHPPALIPQSMSSGGHSHSLFPPNPSPRMPLSPPPSYATSQDELIQRLGLDTGMNYSYSKKCLVENDFNYEKALAAFKVFQSQGKIPLDAFQ